MRSSNSLYLVLVSLCSKAIEQLKIEKVEFNQNMVNQNDTMKDMIDSTIKNCEQINFTFEHDMEVKCLNIFQTMSDQAVKEHKVRA